MFDRARLGLQSRLCRPRCLPHRTCVLAGGTRRTTRFAHSSLIRAHLLSKTRWLAPGRAKSIVDSGSCRTQVADPVRDVIVRGESACLAAYTLATVRRACAIAVCLGKWRLLTKFAVVARKALGRFYCSKVRRVSLAAFVAIFAPGSRFVPATTGSHIRSRTQIPYRPRGHCLHSSRPSSSP